MPNNKWDKIFSMLDRVVEAMLFIIVMIMLSAGVAQIVSRYILKQSLSWSEELMRFLYVWLTLIGTSLAIRRNQFTVIDAIANAIRSKSKIASAILYIFTVAMQLGFFVMLTKYGWALAAKNFFQDSPAMRISMGVAYLALPIGGALGIIYSLISIRDHIIAKKGAKSS